MKKGVFIICMVMGYLQSIGQVPTHTPTDASVEHKKEILIWLHDLYNFGIDTKDDSLLVISDIHQLINDADLRAVIYPEKYEWPIALALMEKMQLKKAFWHFINLYRDPAHQELVMKVILKYDTIFQMDRALLSSFYTYSMLDPDVVVISENGQVEIRRPDIAEDKLSTLQDMVNYIVQYRGYVQQAAVKN